MDKYLNMADIFIVGAVTSEHVISLCDDCLAGHWSSEIPNQYAAHAINSHDELVAEVDRLHQVMQRCYDALYIADKFCGNHTADECDDSIAIPIKDALVEAAKELAK